MKKNLLFLVVFFLQLIFLTAEQLTISCVIDSASPEKSYFSWTAAGKTTKDMFDAVSGASKKHSTKEFNSVITKEGKRLLPNGIRNTLLFAVSNPDAITSDALSFNKNGKIITIQFIHRGNAYKIVTDQNGAIDFSTGCFVHEKIAENKSGVFTIDEKFLRDDITEEEKKSAHDFSLVDWEKLTLSADKPEVKSEQGFKGKLHATVTQNTLRINGTLIKSDNEKKNDSVSETSLFGAIKEKIQSWRKKKSPEKPSQEDAQTEVETTDEQDEQEDEQNPEESEVSEKETEENTNNENEESNDDPTEIEPSKIDDMLKKLDSLK